MWYRLRILVLLMLLVDVAISIIYRVVIEKFMYGGDPPVSLSSMLWGFVTVRNSWHPEALETVGGLALLTMVAWRAVICVQQVWLPKGKAPTVTKAGLLPLVYMGVVSMFVVVCIGIAQDFSLAGPTRSVLHLLEIATCLCFMLAYWPSPRVTGGASPDHS